MSNEVSVKDRVKTCFGSADLKFAIHHSDKKSAVQLLAELSEKDYDAGKLREDISEALKEMLISENKHGFMKDKEINWEIANKNIEKSTEDAMAFFGRMLS